MSHRLFRLSVAAALAAVALSALTPNAHAQTIDSVDRGWYLNDGFHNPDNDNYVAGQNGSAIFRDFFVFSIPSPAAGQQYTAAAFRFNTYDVVSADASETYQLRDYTGSISSLVDGTGGVAAYNDLEDGADYGSITVLPTQDNQFVTVTLNAAALASINTSAGGQFVFGGSVSTLDGAANDEYIAGGSGTGNPSDGNTQLLLTSAAVAVPEASTFALALPALAMVGTVVIKRRKK